MTPETLTLLMNRVTFYQDAIRQRVTEAKEAYQTSKRTDIPEYAAIERVKAMKLLKAVVWHRRRLKQAKKRLLEALMIDLHITDYEVQE
jgi:hypothetical protein